MRRIILPLALLLALTMLTACGGHTIPEPSRDISGGTRSHFDEDWNPVIQGVVYDRKLQFTPANNESGTASDYAGAVIGYFINDNHNVYYCEAEGLDSEEWLIVTEDGRLGHPQPDYAYFIKAKTVTAVPTWLKTVEN